MAVLNDDALSAALKQKPPLVSGLRPNDFGNWESHIQPASIDLTIGDIFVPPEASVATDWSPNPVGEYLLEQGQTAVVRTAEELCLPHDIAAIGFPPAKVSLGGLLTTNPGHIDPGYKGRLTFTVINFGKKPFDLKSGSKICTVVFIRMESVPRVSYDQLDVANRPSNHNALA